jgi:hypothetical protein
MIPRILHQIWLGNAPMPPVMQAWHQRLKELHPSWQLLLWHEENDPSGRLVLRADDYVITPTEEVLKLLSLACHLSQRSNIWRYFLMWNLGGLYLDTDIEPRKPFDDLVTGLAAFTAKRQTPNYTNECAFFGATPNHPWTQHLAKDMRTENPCVSLSLGADYFTHITKQHPDVYVFPENAIAFKTPEGGWVDALMRAKVPSEHTDDSLVSPETYAIHHWSSLWYKKGFETFGQ